MILKAMTTPFLRAMSPADVEPATEMILRNDWGVRRDWLEFATSQPDCFPVIAEADGTVVATGVGTANGAVGWIGTIFVEPAWRGRGLGRSITQSIIGRLDGAGCRTLALVATNEGRQLYERMGFEIQTQYRIFQAVGLPSIDAPDGVRSFQPADLPGLIALDREGTGEDRSHAITRFAAPETARVLTRITDAGDEVEGFVIRAPWGGGATVARTPDAALRVITARRRAAGPAGRVRVGLLDENAEGRARLTEVGFRLLWSAPRMVRGEPIDWHPDWIYGQFNHAMG
jgi:GNAT superfamily N-acetyltransferase